MDDLLYVLRTLPASQEAHSSPLANDGTSAERLSSTAVTEPAPADPAHTTVLRPCICCGHEAEPSVATCSACGFEGVYERRCSCGRPCEPYETSRPRYAAWHARYTAQSIDLDAHLDALHTAESRGLLGLALDGAAGVRREQDAALVACEGLRAELAERTRERDEARTLQLRDEAARLEAESGIDTLRRAWADRTRERDEAREALRLSAIQWQASSAALAEELAALRALAAREGR